MKRLVRLAVLALALQAMPPATPQPEATLSPSLLRDLAAETRKALAAPSEASRPRRLPQVPTGLSPRDLAEGWGTSALYCPHFQPDLYPGKNLDEMCREDFLTSPWLFQTPTTNPFVVARDELARLWDDDDLRRQRLPLALGYAFLNRDCEDWANATVLALLRPTRALREEVIAGVVAPPITSRLPEDLRSVATQPGDIAVDVRVATNVSYDSVACTERSLITAAQRGVEAMVVADRGRIDGAQAAGRAADRLKLRGLLPHDFMVLQGQVVESSAGAVLALAARDVIPSGMTLRKTVEQVHRDGGLAYLLHPTDPGAPERLRKLDLDGYMTQPGVFETFRLGRILGDASLANKPGLAGSNSLYSTLSGLPYTVVAASEVSPEGVREAVAGRRFYAAPALYLPFMTAASLGPVAKLEALLDNWFRLHDFAETHVARWLGADCVTLTTTWDDEIRDMMGLTGLPRGLRDLWRGGSPLRRIPHLGSIGAEFGWVRLGYDDASETAFLGAVVTW